MVEVLDCEPLPSSVRSARLFVVDKLQEWRCDDLVDGVALLTSELATNAVKHTNQPFQVAVEKTGDRIRVEVVDAVTDRPQPYTEGDEFGLYHGLNVVESIATDWGCDEHPNGKVVWFELDGACSTGDAGGVASLRDLRSPEPEEGLPSETDGNGDFHHPPSQEATEMATREDLIEERDRLRDQRDALLEERGRQGDDRRFYEDEDRRGNPIWKVLLVLLILAAGAVIAFFAFGGSADVDTEGDLEVPSVDVDVNAPDVDVDSEEAPPASAEADADQSG